MAANAFYEKKIYINKTLCAFLYNNRMAFFFGVHHSPEMICSGFLRFACIDQRSPNKRYANLNLICSLLHPYLCFRMQCLVTSLKLSDYPQANATRRYQQLSGLQFCGGLHTTLQWPVFLVGYFF